MNENRAILSLSLYLLARESWIVHWLFYTRVLFVPFSFFLSFCLSSRAIFLVFKCNRIDEISAAAAAVVECLYTAAAAAAAAAR